MRKPGHDGFGWLAPIYDPLAGFIFRGRIRDAKIHFLNCIPARGDVLILGGGTGWIIDEVLRTQSDAHICFVDSSEGMIRRAKHQHRALSQVEFIMGTIEQVPQKKFDIIILPFFLDMFSEKSMKQFIAAITPFSHAETKWLVTDFVNHGKWWEKSLLFTMYRFFRLICGIEASTLQDWKLILSKSGLNQKEGKSFYGGFIESTIYRSA